MTYLLVMLGFMAFFLTMAVGVMMGMKPIAGSCGGLAQAGLNGECKVCGKTPGSCDPDNLDNTPDSTLNNKTSVNPALIVDAAKVAKKAVKKPRHPDPLDF